EIAERRKAEEALKESELKLAEIVDFQPDAILAVDLKGKVIAWNRAIEEMTGVKAGDMLGRDNYEYALPFYQTRRPILLDMVLCPEENLEGKYFFITREKDILIAETEVPYVKGESRILWAKAAPIYNTEGKTVGAIESIRDITERKRAEETLRENEIKYRALFESSPDAIMLSDKKGIFDCNWATLRIFGFTSKDEIIGRHPGGTELSPLKQPDGKDSFESANVHTAKAVREGWNFFEWMHKKADGTIFPTEISLNRFELEGRNVLQIIVRDITERKQAEEEKKKLELQLHQAQKMESIGTLAGGVAHDFNNLIMGIQGWAELLLMDTDPNHPHFERLKEIENIAKRAAGLTKQLLGFARGGKYQVKPTDLNKLIEKSSQMFGRTRKEIEISIKYQKDIWMTESDQGQIEQVLLNLYINAWEAMKEGGNLYLQTENIILDEEYVKSFKIEPGRYVKITVTDTGIGMDKKTQKKVFDPFFTTKHMGGGTGLGLASVYGIIKNHDGFINVYSEKGKGATFTIYLPASEAGTRDKGSVARKEELLKGDETILLVDDEEMIIKVAKETLKSLGYQVLLARSGKQAIKEYKKNKEDIDMVILDMVMPEMGGGKTYDQLKKVNPKIKVLLSSGYSINGEAREILNRGCDSFIQKPFNISLLSQTIREILDKKR
ncbi:MAG: PAS domain S-box protein, partial [Proteobacteria bacterium]|nr:PAS domain S-box protein [Pseudomonadota bacterium]